ncbi:MAG TPA: hypothetical protein VGX94_09970 [Terriglobia bacterium]|nr:hypothetical protein [Terriglobia bacterium]
MCPACIATLALIVAGATSTGGFAAFGAKKLRAKKIKLTTQIKGEQNGNAKGE